MRWPKFSSLRISLEGRAWGHYTHWKKLEITQHKIQKPMATKRTESDGFNESDNKRLKTEPNLSDELEQVLNQPIPTFDSQNNDLDIDFNNLPDDLLDSVDATVATPDISRATTPFPDDRRNMMRTQLNLSMAQPTPRTNLQTPNISNDQLQPLQLLHTNDPTKLNDALAAAGVDVQREEELLIQQRMNRNAAQIQQYHQQPRGPIANFLNPYHINSFMQKTARENGVIQNFLQDSEILELMSASCEKWISDIVCKTIIIARHRQNSAPIGKSKNGTKGDLYSELRLLAKKHRELEEKRVEKRIALGLEKPGENNGDNKAGAEETLHRAANATAAMMTTGKKKYSWMTSGAGGNNAGNNTASESKDSNSKRSHLLSLRGDNGIRVNNTRISQAVTMKDLLSAIEDERMGVQNAIVKGYSKLRD